MKTFGLRYFLFHKLTEIEEKEEELIKNKEGVI